MPTIYCAFSGCGAAVTYSGVKPTKCPKCYQSFAAAFKVEPVIPKEEMATARKVTKPARHKRHHPSRFNRDEVAPETTFMAPLDGQPVIQTPSPDMPPPPDDSDDYDDSDDDVSEDQISSYAQELKASLNPDDIIIHLDEDGPVRYRDWVGKPKDKS